MTEESKMADAPNLPERQHTYKKTFSRISAVQVLYSNEIQNQNIENSIAAILDFYEEAKNHEDLGKEYQHITLDRKFLYRLLEQAQSSLQAIDELIVVQLGPDAQNLGRLDLVLQAILRLGSIELKYFTDIPPKVIINEYTSIAKSFFEDKEVGFVNGVLDSLSRKLR